MTVTERLTRVPLFVDGVHRWIAPTTNLKIGDHGSLLPQAVFDRLIGYLEEPRKKGQAGIASYPSHDDAMEALALADPIRHTPGPTESLNGTAV